tara:strand:+ start:5300 stop:5797 length:498 start_codon:yes stop_codon:yes gene_type:complete
MAIPLREAGTRLETGVSLAVAVAKLNVMEFHYTAMRAETIGRDYDARYDDCSALFDCYMLVRGTAVDGVGLCLAAELHGSLGCVDEMKNSMGHFASDMQVFSMRPQPEAYVEDLQPGSVEYLAEESGFDLPWDWETRVTALEQKHMPAPVWSKYRPRRSRAALRV